ASLLEQLRKQRDDDAMPKPRDVYSVVQPVDAAEPLERVHLDANVGPLRASPATFGEIIDRLRKSTGANIFVNWRAMETVRVTRELPVTTDLSGLTLEAAVKKLLADVGSDEVRLAYTEDDGVLTITTPRDAAKNTLTRVYDIRK